MNRIYVCLYFLCVDVCTRMYVSVRLCVCVLECARVRVRVLGFAFVRVYVCSCTCPLPISCQENENPQVNSLSLESPTTRDQCYDAESHQPGDN